LLVGAGLLTRLAVPAEAGWWATFAAGPVLVLLLVSTGTDLWRHLIFNWITYPAFGLALFTAGVNDIAGGWVAGTEDGTERRPLLGTVSFLDSLFGAVACFALLWVGYSLSRRRGAGDVKLATALGAWLGVRMGLSLVLHTYALAGVAVVVWLVLTVGPVRIGRFMLRWIGALILPRAVKPPAVADLPQVQKGVPMAPFFLAGTVLAVLRVFG